MKRSMTPLHSGSPTYDGVIVIPSHFTSLIHASAMYCGPQSHRIRKPRATSFANSPNTWRTPCRRGSSAAQRSPIFAVCQPTGSQTETLPAGWHTAKIGDRWAALEPLRQGVRHMFGRFAKDVARGLRIRCDWGPQYIADAWINEVKWLGMTITPSYVGEPECNGVIERFMRTLKEQCLYLHRFQNLAEAHRLIGEFITRYNTEWLIERLGHQTPVAARAGGPGSVTDETRSHSDVRLDDRRWGRYGEIPLACPGNREPYSPSPRKSRRFTNPRLADRGISRQERQPPRNRKWRYRPSTRSALFRSEGSRLSMHPTVDLEPAD